MKMSHIATLFVATVLLLAAGIIVAQRIVYIDRSSVVSGIVLGSFYVLSRYLFSLRFRQTDAQVMGSFLSAMFYRMLITVIISAVLYKLGLIVIKSFVIAFLVSYICQSIIERIKILSELRQGDYQ